METCKTCRWWGHGQESPHSSSPPPDFHEVESEAKSCGSPKLLNINREPEEYLAVKGDLFGLNYPVCDLVTGPDFGCVQWEGERVSVDEIMSAMQDGEITPGEAAVRFRQLCLDNGVKESPMFDQQERRLLLGHPIVYVDEIEG